MTDCPSMPNGKRCVVSVENHEAHPEWLHTATESVPGKNYKYNYQWRTGEEPTVDYLIDPPYSHG